MADIKPSMIAHLILDYIATYNTNTTTIQGYKSLL